MCCSCCQLKYRIPACLCTLTPPPLPSGGDPRTPPNPWDPPRRHTSAFTSYFFTIRLIVCTNPYYYLQKLHLCLGTPHPSFIAHTIAQYMFPIDHPVPQYMPYNIVNGNIVSQAKNTPLPTPTLLARIIAARINARSWTDAFYARRTLPTRRAMDDEMYSPVATATNDTPDPVAVAVNAAPGPVASG